MTVSAPTPTDAATATEPIEFYRHNLGEEEKRRICEAIDGTILTTGAYTREAEQALAEYLNIPHVVCLDSCTAALHLALVARGIGAGEEVIVPAMTYAATATAVEMAGARPVFADVDPVTANITPATIEPHIRSRTRAILCVHLYGLLCDMPALRALAEAHRLALIEDAAHCIEARRGPVRPGSHGDCACFSFYATKTITCGEGGALATHDAELADRVRRLAQHGIDLSAAERYAGRFRHWDLIEAGWKYNLDNIRASLLVPQIRRLDERWARRREIAERYEQAFAAHPRIAMPRVDTPLASARHLFTIWVDPLRRDRIAAALRERGIGVAVNYRAVHLLRHYRETYGYRRGELPVAEQIGDRTLSLPLYPKLTDAQVERVIRTVLEVVET